MILIIEDEELIRDVLGTILSGADYKDNLAKIDGEVLEVQESKFCDVVLMDIQIPGIGILSTLEELVKIDTDYHIG